MTRIDFYFNVEDKLRQVAELAELALARQRQLMIFLPDQPAAERLETVLWTCKPTSFLPHCRSRHPLAAETPILIDWEGSHLQHDDILINMTSEHPVFFTRFKGLIEVVGTTDTDRELARNRFRFYRDLGYDIRSHDTAKG